MKQKTVVSALSQLCFVLGLGAMVYGIGLWSRPLAFIVCGFVVSAVSLFVGYSQLHPRR
jgi:hypothetical protein